MSTLRRRMMASGEPKVPNNEIWYTTSDGETISASTGSFGDAVVLSNTYADGKGKIVFDRDLTKIGRNSFMDKLTITNIVLPETLTYIDNNAIRNTSIISIKIPDAVTYLGSSCLSGNQFLETAIIGNAVPNIEDYIFENCISLKEIVIPDSVAQVKYHAFYGCSALERVVIGSGVTHLLGTCFANCTSLKEIFAKPSTAPSLISNPFQNAKQGGVVHYKQGANYSSWMTNQHLGGLGWTSVADL